MVVHRELQMLFRKSYSKCFNSTNKDTFVRVCNKDSATLYRRLSLTMLTNRTGVYLQMERF